MHKDSCCINCFARFRDYLEQFVERTGKDECPYCGANTTKPIPLLVLQPSFCNLVSFYRVLDGNPLDDETPGESLEDLVQEDWGIFHEILSDERRGRLLRDVINYAWEKDSGEDLISRRDSYTSKPYPLTTPFWLRYREFRESLKNGQPIINDPDDIGGDWDLFLEELVRFDRKLRKGTRFLRARRGAKAQEYGPPKPWEDEEIHAPPAHRARASRANREGRRVLYVSNEEKTTVAEVRPFQGELVSVAEFRLNREIQILDSTKKLRPINPFKSSRYDLPPSWEREVYKFLDEFTEDLGRPLASRDDRSDYLPTQIICEALEAHYDGIRYPSPQHSGGTNVVVFNPDVADWKGSWLVEAEVKVTNYRIANEDDSP